MPGNAAGFKDINNLLTTGYIYAGGDFGEHANFWPIFCRGEGWNPTPKPKFKDHCVCGQELERNCWIYNRDENRMKVIGSECINKFLDKRRTCHICGDEHQNRIVNRCNDCRPGLCDDCDKEIDLSYSKCYSCKFD